MIERGRWAMANPFEDDDGLYGGGGLADEPAVSPETPPRSRSALFAELELAEGFSDDDDDDDDELFNAALGASQYQPQQPTQWTDLDAEEVRAISESLTYVGRAEDATAVSSISGIGGMMPGGMLQQDMTYPSAELLGLRKRGTTITANASRNWLMRDRGGSHALDVLSAAEDPTSLKFEPRKYLSKVHKETSLDDLKRGMSNLQKRIDDQKDQRMLLVKENFDRCAILPIPCHPPPCSTLSLSLSHPNQQR